MPLSSTESRLGIVLGSLITAAAALSMPGAHEHGPPAECGVHSLKCTLTKTISPDEEAFIAQSDSAMSKMMAEMAAGPSGDIDRDFVAMMIPHHQGAIEMAAAVLRYGRNEQIRRLAQEIIVTQQQEIAVMQLTIGGPLRSMSGSPAEPASP
jgi:hypothetical protein